MSALLLGGKVKLDTVIDHVPLASCMHVIYEDVVDQSPSRISADSFWKCSGAEEIPNGNLAVKTESAKGAMKVVSSADSADNWIYQTPEFASSFVKTSAPASCARVCSTAGRGCLSRLTLRRFCLLSSHCGDL